MPPPREEEPNPLIVLFSGAGVAYFATLPLRLIPAAWESASRSGEFLFVGVGVTAALGMLFLLDRGRAWRAHLVAWGTALIIGSGIIAGWPSSLRLIGESAQHLLARCEHCFFLGRIRARALKHALAHIGNVALNAVNALDHADGGNRRQPDRDPEQETEAQWPRVELSRRLACR